MMRKLLLAALLGSIVGAFAGVYDRWRPGSMPAPNHGWYDARLAWMVSTAWESTRHRSP